MRVPNYLAKCSASWAMLFTSVCLWMEMDAESTWALDLSIALSVQDLHVLAHGDKNVTCDYSRASCSVPHSK